MKRKIRLSALLAVSVLMLALLIGGLYGYFDDIETSTGNVFTAGTLNLVEYTTGSASCSFDLLPDPDDPALNGYVQFLNMAPGDTGSITWTLTNAGSVDGTLFFENVTLTELENSCIDPENAVDATPAVGELAISVDVVLDKYVDGVLAGNVFTGTLSGLAAASLPLDSNVLNPGAGPNYEVYYVLNWSIDWDDVGNEIQSDSATLNVTFYLEQTP